MRRIVLVSTGFLLLVGCGPPQRDSGTLKGTITYKGQAVNGATLLLYPTKGLGGGEGPAWPVPVGQDGTFDASEVPAGDYAIVVEPAEGSGAGAAQSLDNSSPEMKAKAQGMQDKLKTTATIPIPDKYKVRATSNLSCTIAKGTNPPLKLELKD